MSQFYLWEKSINMYTLAATWNVSETIYNMMHFNFFVNGTGQMGKTTFTFISTV